jgi:DNA-binding MarR family transcriptional regulator/GNAT superfamily N-acetyltransferase
MSTIQAIRRFNRFYTGQIGVLEEGLLQTPFTLTEARLIYEVAQREPTTATVLREELGLDAGYLSRLLRALQERGVLEKRTSESDGRQSLLSLTTDGRAAFARLDAASQADIQALIDRLPPVGQRRLVDAMHVIETLLGSSDGEVAPDSITLRAHRPGDMGWVVHRQAVLYHQEYGWSAAYEALIARIIADFLDHFDAARERCWIAERAGEIVGSIFVVKHPEREGVAKLRLLYVEPSARGLGIGRQLVQEVTRFARQAGYHTLTLWTNSVLVSARRLYEAEGYRLVSEQPHHSFGQDLIGQTWELAL